MRRVFDLRCPRCNLQASVQGLDFEMARAVGLGHVCADGVATPCGEPTERLVPGPGERTKLPEERDVNRW